MFFYEFLVTTSWCSFTNFGRLYFVVISVMAAVSGVVIALDVPIFEDSSLLLMRDTPFLICANLVT